MFSMVLLLNHVIFPLASRSKKFSMCHFYSCGWLCEYGFFLKKTQIELKLSTHRSQIDLDDMGTNLCKPCYCVGPRQCTRWPGKNKWTSVIMDGIWNRIYCNFICIYEWVFVYMSGHKWQWRTYESIWNYVIY